MKQNRISSKLNWLFFLLFLMLVYSCEIEKFESSQIDSIKDSKAFNTRVYSGHEILKEHKWMKKQINKFNSQKNLKKGEESVNYNFSLDTTRILKLRSNSFETYTFNIHRDRSKTKTLENYILIVYTDGSYNQWLVEYPILESGNDKTYDFENSTITVIRDDTLLKREVGNLVPCLSFPVGQVCIDLPCIPPSAGGNGSGEHMPGDNCNANSQSQPSKLCTTIYSTGPCRGSVSDNGAPRLDLGDIGVISGVGSGNNSGGIPPNDVPPEQDPGEGDMNDCFTKDCDDKPIIIPLPEIPYEEDPCEEILDQLENQRYENMLEVLKGNTDLTYETGYSEESNGTFTELDTIPGSRGTMLGVTLTATTIGVTHVHFDDREVDKDGDGVVDTRERTDPNLSYGDVLSFFDLLLNAKENSIDFSKIYYTMVRSTGVYTIRFTGDINDIENASYDEVLLEERYRKDIDDYGKEKGFLMFIKNTIGIEGIRLFKIKPNEVVKEKYLNDNNNKKSRKC